MPDASSAYRLTYLISFHIYCYCSSLPNAFFKTQNDHHLDFTSVNYKISCGFFYFLREINLDNNF